MSMQVLMKQRCFGTILTAISKNKFLSMPLSFIVDDIQQVIAQVKAVEIAIKRNEAAVITYMEQQSKRDGLYYASKTGKPFSLVDE